MPPHRLVADFEQLRDLAMLETDEETQLHDLGLDLVLPFQFIENFVDFKDTFVGDRRL